MSIDFTSMGLRDFAGALASGETTSAEICSHFIARTQAVDGKIKAFLKFDTEDIMRRAAEADKRREKGKTLSDYDGIPIGIKDCILTASQTCSCASKILENVVAPYDSTVVARLQSHGFIPFGRLNMDEFAMGASCENSAFQKTANPHDLNRVPGGSSGGSAASVAAGELPVSLGSDTGGSIRQPASFCGCVGLKPTYGRVSRYGLVAFASSLDQIGPLCRNVEDAAVVLDIIGGIDPKDSTSLPQPCGGFAAAVADAAAKNSLKGLKVGLPKEYMEEDMHAVSESMEILKSLGAEFVDISLPHTKYGIATYYIIATAEASANLARFDGIRYGARSFEDDLIQLYFKTRGKGFGDEVKRRILLGTYVLSSGYYDAYYLRAQKTRTLIRQDFAEAAKLCDVILTPTTPSVAFKFGEKADPLQMYLADKYTVAVNLAGICAISVPAVIDADTNMPMGVQFMAPALAEEKLLRTARVFELNRKRQNFSAGI